MVFSVSSPELPFMEALTVPKAEHEHVYASQPDFGVSLSGTVHCSGV